MDSGGAPRRDAPGPPPGPRTLFLAFLRLGATAFGGPAMVAHMRELAVFRRRWMSEQAFGEGLALCQTVPGATAIQCAAYVGLRVAGLAGALAAYAGFGLPAFALMLAVSIAYSRAIPLLAAQAVLLGLRAAVVAIVASAAVDFARASLKSAWDGAIALGATALMVAGANPVLIIGAAGLAGMLLPYVRAAPHAGAGAEVGTRWALLRLGLVLAAGAAGVLALLAWAPQLARLALAMMKVDVLALGGGFTALPLMFEEFVRARGALSARAFMDGIALGQVTPGPIVITGTFVGYQIGGAAAAAVATLGLFFPSFAMVVGLAPWFERLQQIPRFRAATRGAALSFVGLLVAVAFRFASAVEWTVVSACLAIAAFVALRSKIGVLWIVAATGALGALFLGGTR